MQDEGAGGGGGGEGAAGGPQPEPEGAGGHPPEPLPHCLGAQDPRDHRQGVVNVASSFGLTTFFLEPSFRSCTETVRTGFWPGAGFYFIK